ncbi:MAG: zinc dependent phospholipase C family protein, partial [Myxococcales bacterium]|nr:zinc dependent phospholipase C family protein [Myxococcales bacterium]
MALARLRFLLAFVLALGVSTTATSASAFSTRIHIMIANRVHDALEASGDGTIGLLPNGYRVTLPEDDVRAILEHPKAFRAGAIGPDNTVFPAQTDATHGLHASPFEQCELLYQAAVTREERAYALGCFLHGSSDVVAHHYVNFLTGETFTLNPVSEGRASSFSNVVRHILAEDMIQAAAVAADPTAFTLQRLDHEIPRSFVLRTYFDRKSPVYATMAEHSLATYEAHLAAHPDENLVERLATLNVAPYEYLVLAPVFVDEIQEARVALRKVVEDDIAWFQDPTTPEGAELGVTAGLDGQLGTSDDETACAASCPVLYAQYFVQVGLLAPRFDGNGQPLPSAFDKISDELGEDVGLFLPSLLQTIQNLSTTLNAPPGGQTEGLGDLDQATILAHFAPMTGWAQDVANIDYETLIHSILPDWILTLQSTLNAIGVNIQVADLVAALFEPVVAPIRDGIQDFVITTAADYLESFAAEYKASFQVVQAEYEARLAAAAPQDVEGISYDYFYDSGLFVHTFNLSTAALANHEVVLPHGEGAARFGARTFDASHTHEWIQAGVCDHLRAAVFPYGADVQGALSVSVDGVLHPATTDDDSPIECHDGSLFEFASTPGPEACAVTDLETLVADAAHRGSLSRAYPPSYLGLTPTCADVEVPGIPIPGSGGAG